MKYEYCIEEKHGKHWWELNTAYSYETAKLLLKDRKTIRPDLHYRISRRTIGKLEVIKEV